MPLYDPSITSRLFLRLALVVASLAWTAFVFSNTIGDPGRGEEIADAVLDDPDARAEIAAPVASALVQATGLPETQEPTVAAVVDEVLRDPQGARSFVEPFAGSWARLLGEDDLRPAVFNVAPIAADVEQRLAAIGVPLPVSTSALPVPEVPLPGTQLSFMADARDIINGLVVPLAIIATGLAAIAFIIGNKRKVVRKVGFWGIGAGAFWIVIPFLLIWFAQAFVSGADAIVAASVNAATSGMRIAAAVMMIAGGVFVAGSVLVPSPRSSDAADRAAAPPEREQLRTSARRKGRRQDGAATPPYGATQPMPHQSNVPVGHVDAAGRTHAPAGAPTTVSPATYAPGQAGNPGAAAYANADRTTATPVTQPRPGNGGYPPAAGVAVPGTGDATTVTPTTPAGPGAATPGTAADPDSDSLWDFYAPGDRTRPASPPAAPRASEPADDPWRRPDDRR